MSTGALIGLATAASPSVLSVSLAILLSVALVSLTKAAPLSSLSAASAIFSSSASPSIVSCQLVILSSVASATVHCGYQQMSVIVDLIIICISEPS